jgi:thermitase
VKRPSQNCALLYLPTVLFIVVAAGVVAAQNRMPKESVPAAVPGEIVVKFSDSPPGKVDFVSAMNFVKRLGAESVSTPRGSSVQRFTVRPERIENVLARLADAKSFGIEAADRNHYVYAALDPPKDPYFPSQWNLGIVQMRKAWEQIPPTTREIVAIVDTGIDYTHPDLMANIWKNQSTGKDPQGNPVDDHEYGISFCSDAKPRDPVDLIGHGTNVAGIIGAEANNNTDIAGVVWKIQLMAIKALCRLDKGMPVGNVGDAVAGIEYALKRGVTTINLSWTLPVRNTVLERVLAQSSAVFIVAVGNQKANIDNDPVYPARYDLRHVIGVAATTDTDKVASFSNYGVKGARLGAPGEAVLTTAIGGRVEKVQGTSFAAPHVTGCAALLRVKYGAKRDAIISVLTDKADVALPKDAVRDGRRLNCGNAAN